MDVQSKQRIIYGSAEYHGDNLMVSCSTNDTELCGCMVKGQGSAITAWQAREVTKPGPLDQSTGAEHC